jgi:hypothetical protein
VTEIEKLQGEIDDTLKEMAALNRMTLPQRTAEEVRRMPSSTLPQSCCLCVASPGAFEFRTDSMPRGDRMANIELYGPYWWLGPLEPFMPGQKHVWAVGPFETAGAVFSVSAHPIAKHPRDVLLRGPPPRAAVRRPR